MILSESNIRYYLSLAGFKGSDLNTAVMICYCESGFNTLARNLTSKEDSRGLMQVNVKAHPEYLNVDLYDPEINCMVAYQIFKKQGFSAWKNCNNIVRSSGSFQLSETNKIILFALIGGIALYYTL